MTGDRVAHPLLVSLANFIMDFRLKASFHAFLLLALIPVPKFIYKLKSLRGVLENRLIHECFDFVLNPLKIAARIGIMMSDPLGSLRRCHTPLASCIIDTPESTMLSGVAGKTSSVTMASYKQFGDSFRHEPRTASTTLAQIAAILEQYDPWDDFEEFVKAAKKIGLNGVHLLFWRDWYLSEPALFLTPEPLHHWHKFFWDHDAKWCIHAVGDDEIDFRFIILCPHTGFRHFKEGISKLKQVTGREHRDIQRYIVSVIAGAVPASFVIAIRSLMDFRYLSQAPRISDDVCSEIDSALKSFHDHKQSILNAHARLGKGNRPIENWYIPKLEFMQSVTANIRANGAPIQWSADRTENAHITEIKEPARASNNQNYETQICRYLDRLDKIRRFDLATSMSDAHVDFRLSDNNGDIDSDDEYDDRDQLHCIDSTSALLAHVRPVSSLAGPAL